VRDGAKLVRPFQQYPPELAHRGTPICANAEFAKLGVIGYLVWMITNSAQF
jgi:hypothetical protein